MYAARTPCSDFLPVIGTVVVNLRLNLALNLVLNFSMRKPHTIYLILNRRMLREIRKHPKTKKACFLGAFFENLSEHGSIRRFPSKGVFSVRQVLAFTHFAFTDQ